MAKRSIPRQRTDILTELRTLQNELLDRLNHLPQVDTDSKEVVKSQIKEIARDIHRYSAKL